MTSLYRIDEASVRTFCEPNPRRLTIVSKAVDIVAYSVQLLAKLPIIRYGHGGQHVRIKSDNFNQEIIEGEAKWLHFTTRIPSERESPAE